MTSIRSASTWQRFEQSTGTNPPVYQGKKQRESAFRILAVIFTGVPCSVGLLLVLADRVGFDLLCGAGHLGFESPLYKKNKPPIRVTCSFWRTGWDSNPREVSLKLISSVVPRTDFSGNWANIAPHIGSLGEPTKPLISRRFYPQSRMASRKIRTHRVSPQNGLQNRK